VLNWLPFRIGQKKNDGRKLHRMRKKIQPADNAEAEWNMNPPPKKRVIGAERPVSYNFLTAEEKVAFQLLI